jgi:hypothetical protein
MARAIGRLPFHGTLCDRSLSSLRTRPVRPANVMAFCDSLAFDQVGRTDFWATSFRRREERSRGLHSLRRT